MAPYMAKDVHMRKDEALTEKTVPQATPRRYTIVYHMVLIFAYLHIGGLYGLYLGITSAKLGTILLRKYRLESLSAGTFPGALRVIREAFCQDEAVSIGSEVNKDPQAIEELLELCADAALDGVSLVAVEVSSGEVAAVAFNKLQVASSDSTEKTFFEVFVDERCNRPSSRSLIQFMSNVDARCNLFEKYQTECSLEIMFLATLRPQRQRSLGTILCKLSIDVAKRLKEGPVSTITLKDLGLTYSHMKPREVTNKVPKICQAIWTGGETQRIGAKLGFKVEVKALMTEFVYNGKTYADRLGDQAAYSEVVSLVLD